MSFLIWGLLQRVTFDSLKAKLTSAPTLRHFGPKVTIEIYTDAGSLIQRNGFDEAVIAYAKKTLNAAQRNYGATQLELYAVVFAIEEFQTYLNKYPFQNCDRSLGHCAVAEKKKPSGPFGKMVAANQSIHFSNCSRPRWRERSGRRIKPISCWRNPGTGAES